MLIDNKIAIMHASMISIYPSNLDKSDFHLSIFLAEEMASQLITMYLHIYTGFTKKEKEIWLIESHKKSTGSVKKTEKIKIVMNIEKIKKRGATILAICNFDITDDKNGLIKIKQKVLLS